MPASLDYFHGRAVQEVVEGEEDWQWAIILDGDGVIKNWDQRRTAVPELSAGEGLLLVTMEESATTLKFGSVDPATQQISLTNEVVLTPTQYSITDPIHAQTEVFPQREDEDLETLVSVAYTAELEARTAEGPEERTDEIAEEDDEANEGSQSTADEDDAGASGEGLGEAEEGNS